MTVFADANYAGCKATRKSTSGGCIMWGQHFIRGWSKTQAVIALSSAESEFAGMARGTCEAFGAISVAKDLGSTVEATLFADSSAALGIAGRSGAGKIRYLDTSMLWIQQKHT